MMKKIDYKTAYETLLIAYHMLLEENKKLKDNNISLNEKRKMYGLQPIYNNQRIDLLNKLEKDNFTCVSNLETSGLSANAFEYAIENEIIDLVDKINDIIDFLRGV